MAAVRLPKALSLGAVCAGTVLSWTSPVLPQISISDNITVNGTEIQRSVGINETSTTPYFQLTKGESSLVGSMLAVGALISALPAGFFAEKYGRKPATLFLVLPFMLNWLFIIFASNVFMLYIARFFAGLATGAMCVTAPMYIAEIAEPAIRGTVGSIFQMFICVGILITFFVGSLVNWILLSIILAVVPAIFAGCFYFMPETPVYLIKVGDTASAERSLKFFRGKSYNTRYEMKIIQEDIDSAAEKSAGLKDLVASRGNKKALIASLGLMAFQQLSGINAVIFYTVPIFKSAGSSLPPDVAAIIVAVVQVIVAYIAVVVIDKANRRFFLSLSSLGMVICLAALGIYFQLQVLNITFAGLGVLPVASLVLFIVFFSLGLGPIAWMIMGELFAPEIKGIASGLAVMTNWTMVFFVTFSFPIMNDSLGDHITFYIFASIMFVCSLFVYFVVPETRGKTLQQIQYNLNK